MNANKESKETKKQVSSPFKKAKIMDKRLKLFLWGDSGVGKTTLALQFPSPVVIDLEGGTDLYGGSFDFDVMCDTDADKIMESIDWLLHNKHGYRTLVIDPITIYWDAVQKKWSDIFLLRNKGTKGDRHEFYDLQPRDWMTLKSEFKEFLRKLIAMDMNVIVTARQKALYADGAFMKVIGDTFDGEKSLPYMFDTIVRLYKNEKGKHFGECLKDRSNKLPRGEFECSYAVLEELFGKQSLAREAKPSTLATKEQKKEIRGLADTLGITTESMAKGLAAFNAESLDELTMESANAVLDRLQIRLDEWSGE